MFVIINGSESGDYVKNHGVRIEDIKCIVEKDTDVSIVDVDGKFYRIHSIVHFIQHEKTRYSIDSTETVQEICNKILSVQMQINGTQPKIQINKEPDI